MSLLVEGPEFGQDYSYFLVDKCPDLKDIEKGIPLKSYEAEVQQRDMEMEYRVLIRMNCHKMHYQSLFKSQNLDFKQKNRYNEVLPFTHSMVKLTDIPEIAERYASYINANYINVCLYCQLNHILDIH